MSFLGKKILGLSNKPKKRLKPLGIPSYEKAQKIGIVYTYGDDKKEESIEKIFELINDEKQVDVLCFISNKTAKNSKYPSFHIDELNNWGKFNSPVAKAFIETSFDFLIHLDFELNEIIKNLLINTNAKCRVGLHTEQGANFYELMIGINKSAGSSNFAEQTIKYIKAIR